MNFDPIKDYEKTKDDWFPTAPKKRKLILLPTREYTYSKGTTKRVKVAPAPSVSCVIMRWIDGETNAVPMRYLEAEKRLVPIADGFATVFKSRSEAKKAIWHTCQHEGTPGTHVDFVIVNKA